MAAGGKIFNVDAFAGIRDIPDSSIDAILTDPPYFIDGHKDEYDDKTINRNVTNGSVVKSLRAGMKFDKNQGLEFQKFMYDFSLEALRVLKPGGFLLSFSAPRLYHRLGVAVEDAGFEIRDMWEWLYTQNQMKAMGLSRSLDKALEKSNIGDATEIERIKAELPLWKTPQVKSCFEPIVLAQKPREGTFLDNWLKHHIGLVNVKIGVGANGDMDTANVVSTEEISELLDKTFLVGKPTKTEKGVTTHVSVKPLALMRHLVEVTVPLNGTVLDPFNGSGTTGIAAVEAGRNFIGFEKSPEYYAQSMIRNELHFEVEKNEANFYEVKSK